MIGVLAIDPSLTATGWATLDDAGHLHGTLIPRRRVGTRWHRLHGPARLAWIAGRIRHLATTHHAHLVALEGYSMHSKGNAVTKLAELGGVIRTTLWGANIPYLEVPPASLKLYATGNGNADKNRMLAAAHALTAYDGRSHDQADAILLHALVADALGQGYLTPPHGRVDEALAPVIAAVTKLDLLPTPTGDH